MTMQYVASQTPMYPPTRNWDRQVATITAVHVARDLYIEQYGNRIGTPRKVENYMLQWLYRNGATLPVVGHRHTPDVYVMVEDLVGAVWAFADLAEGNPLDLAPEGFTGTEDEARAMLRGQYETQIADALNRIVWKD